MPTSTVENYLKQIYLEQQKVSGRLVAMGHLALAMNVTPGTATSMVKTLSDSGLVDYSPRVGAQLTDAGEQLALRVLRRHRILELFLVEVLGLDWSEVHEDAENLEHAVSDQVLERMDALLDYPVTDPHGDPIPTTEGRIEPRQLARLTNCTTGDAVRIARVIDQDAQFLQFADKHSLRPGMEVTVESLDPVADSITLRSKDSTLTLGTKAAAKILVEPSVDG
jgi:DtxR family Mn-dependent transcriptional regulator